MGCACLHASRVHDTESSMQLNSIKTRQVLHAHPTRIMHHDIGKNGDLFLSVLRSPDTKAHLSSIAEMVRFASGAESVLVTMLTDTKQEFLANSSETGRCADGLCATTLEVYILPVCVF